MLSAEEMLHKIEKEAWYWDLPVMELECEHFADEVRLVFAGNGD
jgi:hypothetical protein